MACKTSEADTEGGSASSTGTTSTTSVTTTGPTTATTTTTTTATATDTDTPTSEPVTSTTGEPGTTTGEPVTSTTGEPGTTTGTTGTTGETTGGVDCGMLALMACKAEPACKAIMGAKINLAKMCTSKSMFIECVDAMACGEALTIGCDPMVMPPEPYQFLDTCLPTDWAPCEAPVVMGPCK